MTYTLRFVPEIEEDITSAYNGTKLSPRALARNFFGYFMPTPVRLLVILCFIQGFMADSGAVFLGDSRTPYTSQ